MGAYKHVHTSEDGPYIKALMYGLSSNVWIACSDVWTIHTSELQCMDLRCMDSVTMYGPSSDVCIGFQCMDSKRSDVWTLQCMNPPKYGPSDGCRPGYFSGCWSTLPKKTVITFSQFWPVHSDGSIHMKLVVRSVPHLCPHFPARWIPLGLVQ